MRCYSCGQEDVRVYNTWSQDPDNPDEFVYVGVCANCDNGCSWEGGPLDRLAYIRRVFMTYGIQFDKVAQGDGELHGPEFTICVDWEAPEDKHLQVIAWSGSWPDPREHDMGSFWDAEDTAKYCAWLLAREATYIERDERMMAEQVTTNK